MAQRRTKKAPAKAATTKPVERLSEIDFLKLQNAAQAVQLAQMQHQAVVEAIARDYRLKDGDGIDPDGTLIRKA